MIRRHCRKWILVYSLTLACNLNAGWSNSPTTLDNFNTPPNASSSASLIADKNGNVTAAWLENINDETTVQAAYYTNSSNSWSTSTTIDQLNSAATQPLLTVDNTGNVTAVWLEYFSGSYLVQAARFNGTSWTSPITLNNGTQSPNADLSLSPLLTIDHSGDITVLWFEQQGSNYAIQTARFSEGAWTISPVTLNGNVPNAYVGINPQMIVDKHGNVTVVWMENIESTLAVMATRFSGGTWMNPVILDNGIQSPNASPYNFLQAIVDEYGNVTVSWLENNTNPLALQISRFLAPPTVTKISPNYGSKKGGTHVKIYGTNFTEATEVLFGSHSAQSFTVDSATQITAITPHGRGKVTVAVQTGNGISLESADHFFTYTHKH